jgi:hypothetical protein
MCTANALRLLQEFPELVPLLEKLVEEKPLREVDKSNLSKLVEGYWLECWGCY